MEKKKAIMALEALLGTVLSVLALFFIFQAFMSVFFTNSSNLEIAQANAESIVEFVEYFPSNKNYAGMTNCYNLLKLSHIQVTQDLDDQWFFLVLDSEGIYILSSQFSQKYLEELDFSSLSIDASSFIPFQQTGMLHLSTLDETLQQFSSGNSFLEYVVLTPFETTLSMLTIEQRDNKLFLSGRNAATKSSTQIANKAEKYELYYLLYNHAARELFVPESNEVISKVFQDANLCSNKILFDDIYKQILTRSNGVTLDYLNNNVEFEIRDTLTNQVIPETSFEWKSRPVCKKNDIEVACDTLLSSTPSTYFEFIAEIESFLEFSSYPNAAITPILESKTAAQRQATPISLDDFLITTLPEESSAIEYEMKGTFWGLRNEYFQLSNSDEAQKIYVQNGMAYFYYKFPGSDVQYWATNYAIFQKDSQGNLYLLGNNVDSKQVELESNNGMKRKFYYLHYSDATLPKQIVNLILTEEQYNKVRFVE